MDEIRALPVTQDNASAVAYVGTTPHEGLVQLALLRQSGCRPEHRVLEIGCGALIAGYPSMQYLDRDNYAGIDPNKWLIDSSLLLPEVRGATLRKRPTFSSNVDFRAPGAPFDFVLSHSILSHVSSSQFDDFLTAVSDQISPNGKVVASVRLAEGNQFGSTGSPVHGTHFTEWQYPGVSWFQWSNVLARAARAGLSATIMPDFTKEIMRANSKSVHDWLLLKRR